MGSDDLFHKRRSSAKTKPSRKGPKRDPYDRVLVVCEGEKTEPNYLRELIDNFELNSANVEVDGDCESSPDKVFLYVKSCFRDEVKRGDAYDKVYCVIDRDSHPTYDKTIQAIATAKPKNTFIAISSVPCFEYWVLLHYNYVTRPYAQTGRNSPCDSVISDLRAYIPEYAKGSEGIFKQIMAQTDFAIANSERALDQAKKSGTDNPTTLMHDLVIYLRDLKSNEEGN